ncbi:MAG TPA: FtsX-like permease family protein [Streptosporangiaceae bacterium]|nr:FtsX-like permease family protein [Streptosporangiaceae bacterium]
MLRKALASLRYRKARLALSCLAIAAGVAFVTGTLVMGASINSAYFDSFAAGAKNVDAAVTPHSSSDGQLGSDTYPSVPASVLAQISSVPGVASAAGRLVGQAPLLDDSGKVVLNGNSPGFGINLTADPALRGFTVASGHVPESADQVAVDKATAADEHFRIGQIVRVVDHGGRVRAFRLVGTVDLGVDHEFGNSTVTVFQTAAAFSATGRPGYDQIVARAGPGVSQAALTARIGALPGVSGYVVQNGAAFATAEANSAGANTSALTTGILAFAIIALVVACIVIYNTFTILVTQRGRELALERCVGATRRQVFGGMLLESLIVGLIASAAGVVAGLGLGWGLQRLFVGFGATIPSGPLVLTPLTVAIGMVTGVAATVAASVLPARSATRVAPIAALGSQHEQPDSARIGWIRAAVAAVFAGVGLFVTVEGTRNAGFIEITIGGLLCFVAVLALGPLIVPPMIAFFGWLPGKFAGPTVRLAAANARRNPHRMAATTAALTIGLTLMTAFTVVISSAQATSVERITQQYPFDYVVQAGQAGSGGDGQLVPQRVVSMLMASPALGVVAPTYDVQATVNRVDGTDVGAISQSAFGVNVRPTMVSGSVTAITPGAAAIDSSRASGMHVGQGGTIVVSTPDGGAERVRVVAVYKRAGGVLPSVLLSVPDFTRWFRPAGAQSVLINGASGVSTATSRTAVNTAVAGDPLLTVTTLADYRASLSSAVNQLIALFGILLGLAIVIALFGISNTLTLSVIERTRESALMRALGLTRGQLRRMLLTEALYMALIATVLGVGLGAAFAWTLVHSFIQSDGGGVISIPFAETGLFVVIGAVAAQLAAALPARRAARASAVDAMADVG